MSAPQTLKLNERQIDELAGPGGQLGFKLYFHTRPRLPTAGSDVLIEVPAGNTLSRLELDALGNLRFVRGAGGSGDVQTAAVPVDDMLDLRGWHIFLLWRPDGVVLHVGDVERRRGIRSSR